MTRLRYSLRGAKAKAGKDKRLELQEECTRKESEVAAAAAKAEAEKEKRLELESECGRAKSDLLHARKELEAEAKRREFDAELRRTSDQNAKEKGELKRLQGRR